MASILAEIGLDPLGIATRLVQDISPYRMKVAGREAWSRQARPADGEPAGSAEVGPNSRVGHFTRLALTFQVLQAPTLVASSPRRPQ